MASSNSDLNLASKALYDILIKDPSACHFKVLPDRILYPDYYAITSRPVCLADLRNYMTNGRYSLNDMQRDTRRMIANAKRYNRPDSVVYQDALSLEVSSSSATWNSSWQWYPRQSIHFFLFAAYYSSSCQVS